MITTPRKLAAVAVAATALLSLASTSAFAATEDPVELHCSGPDLHGTAVLNCAPATPQQPANQSCNSWKRADDPNTATFLALLGVTAPPNSSVGLICHPIKPAQV